MFFEDLADMFREPALAVLPADNHAQHIPIGCVDEYSRRVSLGGGVNAGVVCAGVKAVVPPVGATNPSANSDLRDMDGGIHFFFVQCFH